MTDELQQTEQTASESLVERRDNPRFYARARAVVVRESDSMRIGLKGELRDLSTVGLGLLMSDAPPEVDEIVKIRLTNEIQRFDREFRGVIRHVTEADDGGHRVGIELMMRMTPLEVSQLKIAHMAGESDAGFGWM